MWVYSIHAEPFRTQLPQSGTNSVNVPLCEQRPTNLHVPTPSPYRSPCSLHDIHPESWLQNESIKAGGLLTLQDKKAKRQEGFSPGQKPTSRESFPETIRMLTRSSETTLQCLQPTLSWIHRDHYLCSCWLLSWSLSLLSGRLHCLRRQAGTQGLMVPVESQREPPLPSATR